MLIVENVVAPQKALRKLQVDPIFRESRADRVWENRPKKRIEQVLPSLNLSTQLSFEVPPAQATKPFTLTLLPIRVSDLMDTPLAKCECWQRDSVLPEKLMRFRREKELPQLLQLATDSVGENCTALRSDIAEPRVPKFDTDKV
jgi:hypothetical protein